MWPCVCSVLDHSRHQNVVRTSVTYSPSTSLQYRRFPSAQCSRELSVVARDQVDLLACGLTKSGRGGDGEGRRESSALHIHKILYYFSAIRNFTIFSTSNP